MEIGNEYTKKLLKACIVTFWLERVRYDSNYDTDYVVPIYY